MTDDYEDDVITKITVVITKMIDDYQDDWWLRRSLWW
jgi:hypothetical protein